jgi:alginate O-acetyltransferase complex protein AlgI
MLFCSQEFLLFFGAVFALYWAMPWQQMRIYLLLIASFAFYARWNEWLAVLIVLSTTIDYAIARCLDASNRASVRRLLLAASVTFNVGILCYFKYANFFLRSLAEALQAMGASSSLPLLSVILPIGISFYTFEAISYAVDVYRRKIRAEKSLAHFMLFILFFPHLIAGPIVRGSDFLPQVRRKKRWNWLRLSLGARLFLLGMFKKLAIADRMALLTDPVFADPGAFRSGVVWTAVFALAVQIYCDFSGYSDMALGTAHLLGYRLAVNFNMPFAAVNIADFWQRWHISLSSWLRDYLFIPLGGSRGSRWATYRNFLIVMGLGGLWHGASWPPVVWGLLMGAWLCLHRAFREIAQRQAALNALLLSRPGTALRVMSTFVGFCLTLVVFRTASLVQAGVMFHRLFHFSGAGRAEPIKLMSIAVMVALVPLGYWIAVNGRGRNCLASLPVPVRGLALALATCVALMLAPQSENVFIYFKF